MHVVLAILALRTGGAERDLCRVAKSLAHDHKVTIVTLIVSKEERPFYPVDSAVRLVQLDLMRSLQDTLGFWPRTKEICLRPFCVLRYRNALRKLRPDVVISYLTKANILTLLATRRMDVPVIISKRSDPWKTCYASFTRLMRFLTYRWASLIVVQTDLAISFLEKFHTSTLVVPNTVPCSLQITYSHEVKMILSIGRLNEGKDFGTFVKAFHRICYHFPDCCAAICGDGPERNALQQTIHCFGLQDRFSLLGQVKEVDSIILTSDLFVFPSRHEGFSNALAEAMASGLPIIASDCMGNKNLVRDTVDGRLFPVGDAGRLAELMVELMMDFEQRKRLGQEATKITQRFSLERNRTLWKEAIERVTIGRSEG
ncbi:MAG: glycosyltransferase [Holosporales bacterium]|nr:glycosyltransferase [Holosporales bacterium]